jgi:hypothetical protein
VANFINERDKKRGGFAGPGVGDTNDILTLEHVRDRTILDRRRGRVALGYNCALELLIDLKVGELVLRA